MVLKKSLIRPVIAKRRSSSTTSSTSEKIVGSRPADSTINASTDHSFDLSSAPPIILEKKQKLVGAVLLAVIYECIERLRMLTCVYAPVAEGPQVTSFQYSNRRQRFITVTNYGEYTLGATYGDMHKLRKEIGIILFLLGALVKEMNQYGTMSLMNEHMEEIVKMKQDEDALIESVNEKIEFSQYLRWVIDKEKEMSANLIRSYDKTIESAVMTYKDLTENSAIEIKYVKRWEKARDEQNLMILETAEIDSYDSYNWMRWKADLERRCHEEIETYIQESHQEHLDQIQYWMDLYETDIETKENEIYNMKMEIEKINDQYDATKREYEERATQIEEWLQYKRKKKEEEKLAALQNWGATKIQAWWRGVMVRKHLGPYRKKKGKKSKQKK